MKTCETAVALRKVEYIAGLSTDIFCASRMRWVKEGKAKELKSCSVLSDFCWRNRHVEREAETRGYESWSQGDSHCGCNK